MDMEMRFDRRVYRADGDIETFGGTALDLLDNVPSVETDFDGQVSLRGSENVRILINGRPSALLSGGSEALAAIPSENIDRVEVITNPSARYDAEGDAGVINIILKRNRMAGFHGNIVGNTGLPGRVGLTGNMNFMSNNANWFTNLGFRYRERPATGNRFQSFSTPDTSYMYDQSRDRNRIGLRGNARVGAEFFIGENHTLTPSVFFRIRDRSNETENRYRDMAADGTLLSETMREDLEEEFRTNFEAEVAYELGFDQQEDRQFRVIAKFDFQPEIEQSDLSEVNLQTNQQMVEQRRESQEEVSDLLFQTDYVQTVGESTEIEAGAKSTFRWVDNMISVEEMQNDSWITLPQFSDDFNYYENINAVYGIVSRQWDRLSLQAGLRAEQTVINSGLDETTGEGLDLNYFGLYPSAFLGYEINEKNSIQASYSKRLSRPRFRWVRPYSNYRDSRNIRLGNPGLEPVESNSYELSYLRTWDSGSVMTGVYHRYRTGVIEHITDMRSDGVTERRPVNLSEESNWGSELTINQRVFNTVRLWASANYFTSDRNGTYNNQEIERSTNALFGRFRVQWRIMDGLNVQTTMRYRGPRETTQGRRAASYSFNSGIAKELFDGNATLSINARDIFNNRGRDIIIDEPNFYSRDEYSWGGQQLRLNFTWRFSSFNS
jgi:outer membrane receptor protein involved in Fe transport